MDPGSPRGGALPWPQAWQDALYGEHGFYRAAAGPAGHFTTSAHGGAGSLLAGALWRWADALGMDGIIDLGAGRGELLAQLRAHAPGRPLTGVDIVARPQDLADDIDWLTSPGGSLLPEELAPVRTLVFAQEWLDVVPCPVAELDAHNDLRYVLVDRQTGREQLGQPVAGPDLEWCERFWPSWGDDDARTGDRVEVGRSRDEAWTALLARLVDSAAIAVDYGHTTADRPRRGTLTAYRDGVQVTPVPDGSCDLTAHVAVDSLHHDELVRQREALLRVGLDASLPDHARSRTDPGGYLVELARASAAASLLSREALGSFWWVVARTPPPPAPTSGGTSGVSKA